MDASEPKQRFSGWKLGLLRAIRALLGPLAIALPPLFWVALATQRASLTPLGRDQGIFQYIAWAVTQGARDYRDVRDVNGPLTHLVHRVFLALGGADEHRFRVLDLLVTGAAFAFAGACVAGFGRSRAVRVEALERVAWGIAAWVVLGGQYLGYLYWDLAQRESFFDWFMISSVALQLVAQAPPRKGATPRRQAMLIGLVAALSVIPWFGKPTYVLFSAAQLVALLVDGDCGLPWRKRFVAFAAGGVFGAVTQLAFLFATGDAGAYFRIAFSDVPAMYRFIWPRAASDILALPRFATEIALGLVTGVTMLGLVFTRQIPRRAVAVALVPACGLVSVVVQAKGFPYHFHPVTAGIALQWLVLAAWLWERARTVPRSHVFARVAPFIASAALALRVATQIHESPHLKSSWVSYYGATPEGRESAAYFALFPEVDFFPYELRQTAKYLREHTLPTDRVQLYGMDPYLLFLAERLSATPYIYAYDLNVDAALSGGAGGAPDEAQSAKIRAMRDAHERDMLGRLESAPPAAFVFLDKSPLMTWTDAVYDFNAHCPETAAWLRERYEEAAAFGTSHVWLRRDAVSPAN